MTTTLFDRTTTADLAVPAHATSPTGCQAYAGSLLVPCPNLATHDVVRRGATRRVCPAHV